MPMPGAKAPENVFRMKLLWGNRFCFTSDTESNVLARKPHGV
jgi:hypothetical protein